MCFHVSNIKTAKQNEERFDASFEVPEIYEPYYHLAGYDKRYMYIITQEQNYDIVPAYWKLLPEYWDISNRNKYKASTWNARGEDIFDTKSYRKHIFENRCLILADGFFEPHKKNGETFPHYIKYKDHSLFAFAGVYNEIDDGLYTCSIVTTQANEFFSKIHNVKKKGTFRMPLVLDESDEFEWINPDLREGDIRELLYTFTSKKFESYTVSKDINYPDRYKNHPDILKEVNYTKLTDQRSLFS